MTRDILIVLLVVLAGLGFVLGIAEAGYYTAKRTPAAMPRFLAQVVTTVGAVLATNLGAVLGLSVADVQSASTGLPLARAFALSSWLAAPGVPVGTQVQIAAAWIYVIGLIAAAFLWGLRGFSDNPAVVVPTLPELSRTLLGVIVGALAVALGAGSV